MPLKEAHILQVLHQKELYSLEIADAINQDKMGFASLYPALHSLERKNLIESRWGDETPEKRGGARRRYYKLTKKGENALQNKVTIDNLHNIYVAIDSYPSDPPANVYPRL